MKEENLNKDSLEDIKEDLLNEMKEELKVTSALDELLNKVEKNLSSEFSEAERNEKKKFMIDLFTSDEFLKTLIKGGGKNK